MVEKIDRPDPAPTYQVVSTTAAKDQKGQSGPQAQTEDEFSSPGTPAEWRRLHGARADRKLLRIRTADLRRAWFRQAVLHSRAVIVETDLELANGQILQRAQFLVPRLEEFWQWKGYAAGQEVPLALLLHAPDVEVSVPHHGGIPETARRDAAPASQPEGAPARSSWWRLWDARTGALHPRVLALYLAAAAVGIGLLLALL